MSRIDIRPARRFRPVRTAFAGVLAAVTLSSAAHAADVVVTNDGREFIGEIIEERADAIVIRTTVAGINTTLTLARRRTATGATGKVATRRTAARRPARPAVR